MNIRRLIVIVYEQVASKKGDIMHQLTTPFSEHLDKNNILQEYPRPNLKRKSYINLNGYWDYAITNTSNMPHVFDGKILVPFSPESLLSGVKKIVTPKDYLWYHREFLTPYKEEDDKVILHFGAVDQYAYVYVNGQFVTSHIGGYLPFEVDITPYLNIEENGVNNLVLIVRDLTDTSYHARGKQKLKPSGMFYTPSSGIWQTVWMECVPCSYVKNMKITPDYDEGTLSLDFDIEEGDEESLIQILIYDMDLTTKVYEGNFLLSEKIKIEIIDFKAWSPEEPYLYQLYVTVGKDNIESYFAMRKFSVDIDENGIKRLFLNNKPYFHNGLLDQGYWPEGLYTAPTDKALQYDIIKAKKLGFNMLRKHAKLEPLRWYYHCDRIGMLVWQDMVNGGTEYNTNFVTYFPNIFPRLASKIKDNSYHLFSRVDKKGQKEFISELRETVTLLYNYPSIAMWVPFNEGWGQFDSHIAVEEIRNIDTTRTIDHASGWFDQQGGDVKSHHIYFTAFHFKPEKRAVVLSEFGGYVYRVKEHYYSEKTYGYRTYKSKEALTKAYKKLYLNKIIPAKKKCLSAAVYTQITDVEEEINGLITYDRKVVKIDEKVIRKINRLIGK